MPILQIFYKKLLEISIFISKNLLIVQKNNMRWQSIGFLQVFCSNSVRKSCKKPTKPPVLSVAFPEKQGSNSVPCQWEAAVAFIPII